MTVVSSAIANLPMDSEPLYAVDTSAVLEPASDGWQDSKFWTGRGGVCFFHRAPVE